MQQKYAKGESVDICFQRSVQRRLFSITLYIFIERLVMRVCFGSAEVVLKKEGVSLQRYWQKYTHKRILKCVISFVHDL